MVTLRVTDRLPGTADPYVVSAVVTEEALSEWPSSASKPSLDALPAADRALAIGVVAGADNSAVAAQSKRVGRSCRHRDQTCPVTDVTLAVAVVADCESSTLGRECDGVVATGCQRRDVLPVAYLAGTRGGVSGSPNLSVGHQRESVKVSGRYGCHVAPLLDVTLSATVTSHGDNCAVSAHSY